MAPRPGLEPGSWDPTPDTRWNPGVTVGSPMFCFGEVPDDRPVRSMVVVVLLHYRGALFVGCFVFLLKVSPVWLGCGVCVGVWGGVVPAPGFEPGFGLRGFPFC